MLPASERLLLFKERLRVCTCPTQASVDKRRALLEVVEQATFIQPLIHGDAVVQDIVALLSANLIHEQRLSNSKTRGEMATDDEMNEVCR
jgi:hypothetical protein